MTSRDGIQVKHQPITRPGRPQRNLPDRKRNNSSVEVDGMEYDLSNLLTGEGLVPQDPKPVQPSPTTTKTIQKPKAKPKPKTKKKSSLSSLNIGQHRTKPKKALGLAGLSIGSRSLSSDSLDTDCQSLDTCEVFRKEKAQFDKEQSRNNGNNDSGVFFQNDPKARRQSPYRFNIMAMKTLMTSFSDIPELQGSFRLSKEGQVLEIGDDSDHGTKNRPAGLLGGDDYGSEDEDEEDLFAFAPPAAKKPPPSHNYNHSNNHNHSSTSSFLDTKPAASSLQKPPPNYSEAPPEFMDSAIKDLIFDEATGTYVYRDDVYYQDKDEDEKPQSPRGSMTLEEMCEQAQNSDEEYDDEDHEMEISPGVYVPFRGAKETWQAVATRSTVDIYCLDCNAHLVCVNDCEYTVCPDCRVVNPIFCDNPIGKPYGVGMGFKKEWVLKKEMISREKKRRSSDAMSLQSLSQRFVGVDLR